MMIRLITGWFRLNRLAVHWLFVQYTKMPNAAEIAANPQTIFTGWRILKKKEHFLICEHCLPLHECQAHHNLPSESDFYKKSYTLKLWHTIESTILSSCDIQYKVPYTKVVTCHTTIYTIGMTCHLQSPPLNVWHSYNVCDILYIVSVFTRCPYF